MVTTGSDLQMKVFDIRNTFKEIHSYLTPFESKQVRISQSNLTGISFKNQILFWRDLEKTKQKAPYLKHEVNNDKKIFDF